MKNEFEFKNQLDDIITAWPQDQSELRKAFISLAAEIEMKPGTTMDLVSRPEISHSIRAKASHARVGRERPLYTMLDVITPRMGPWMLSLCFYEDEITDVQEYGQAVPQGLYGETGYCFDLDVFDQKPVDYLKERIAEAYRAATAASTV
ncbi:MAG: hypothetical protein JRG97_07635 [Deltaproteobacteria bacterium]|nr:hypothetical protein [Deltaproteobacteria bacterium]MBW2050693.1 hypothetical protein [Deltaproteobacteria bacterium]MBW2140928.1 hypothetical protein [Deltaproteobacteria bacterium]MBW2324382.1 hypothetical protein [Deltaproteobacteria bacterium]